MNQNLNNSTGAHGALLARKNFFGPRARPHPQEIWNFYQRVFFENGVKNFSRMHTACSTEKASREELLCTF